MDKRRKSFLGAAAGMMVLGAAAAGAALATGHLGQAIEQTGKVLRAAPAMGKTQQAPLQQAERQPIDRTRLPAGAVDRALRFYRAISAHKHRAPGERAHRRWRNRRRGGAA